MEPALVVVGGDGKDDNEECAPDAKDEVDAGSDEVKDDDDTGDMDENDGSESSGGIAPVFGAGVFMQRCFIMASNRALSFTTWK